MRYPGHAWRVALLAASSLAACTNSRSFAQLEADADAIPVPRGVTFVSESRGVRDGQLFSGKKYEEVIRHYASSLACEELQRSRADTLRAAGRRSTITNYPHFYGAVGSLGITITDRPPNLVVTIGTDNGGCSKPYVWSSNPQH
jgi:hypothetical protein